MAVYWLSARTCSLLPSSLSETHLKREALAATGTANLPGAKIVGGLWFVVGLAYIVVSKSGFRKELKMITFDEL